MLIEPTLDRLHELGLTGMAQALAEQMAVPDVQSLSFEDRLALLLERETSERDNRRLRRLLQLAKLRLDASFEDIDFRSPRGLDKSLVLRLAGCEWIRQHQVVLITGATGTGKSYLACALAQAACRHGLSTRYFRLSRLLDELTLAKADGSYPKFLDRLLRTQLLALDDYGMAPLNDAQRRDLLEILDDRYGRRATLVTSQLPLEHWHDVIGDPTFGDAILDRLVHHAHRITLKGPSMRKKKPASESSADPAAA
jgi:DNA replication protein DnaC